MRVKEVKKASINGKRYICVNYVCQARLLCPMANNFANDPDAAKESFIKFTLCNEARVLKVDPVNGIPKYETRILAV